MKRSLLSLRTGLRSSLFCLATTAAALSAAHAQNVPPPPAAPEPSTSAVGIGEDGHFQVVEYGQNRYEKMQGKSPFEFELAAPPEPEAQNPFEGLSLAGFVGSSNAITVYLVDAKNERTSVYGEGTGRPNPSGIRIISVNRGPTIRASTVTLEKDGRREDIGFQEEYLNNMRGGAAGAAGGAPGQPGKGNPQQRGGVVRPGGVNTNGIVLPNGAANGGANPAATQRYQAPAAFIPGRGNPQQQGGFIPNQAGNQNGTPQNTAAQQQLINQLLTNQNGQAAQPAQQAVVVPQAGGGGNRASGGGTGLPPTRRRVVLPSR